MFGFRNCPTQFDSLRTRYSACRAGPHRRPWMGCSSLLCVYFRNGTIGRCPIKFCVQLTKSMKRSHSWEASSQSSVQVIHFLWNLKVDYCFQKSLSLLSSSCQVNSVHTFISYEYFILNRYKLYFHLRMGLPFGIFPQVFQLISACIYYCSYAS